MFCLFKQILQDFLRSWKQREKTSTQFSTIIDYHTCISAEWEKMKYTEDI